MSLDVKDRQLLHQLDADARKPINQIAKAIGLSKDTTLYRVKRLEREGIILRYQAYIDHGKLGYMSARINIKLQNTKPADEERLIEDIKRHPFVGFFASAEGNVDLVIWVLVRNVNELNQFWEQINTKYLNYIQKTEMAVYTRIVHYPRSYLTGKKNHEKMTFTSVSTPVEIDETDLAILRILTTNARESSVSIAQELGLSAKTVSSRIKGLEQRKIIQGYTIVLDIGKLGYSYYKLYLDFQNTNVEELRRLDQFILEHPNITYRDYVIAGHSCEIEIQVKDEKELRELIEEIKKEFSSIIRNYEVLHYYKEHKMLSMPWAE